jgi:DNA-binding IclR family transcriptional regulator
MSEMITKEAPAAQNRITSSSPSVRSRQRQISLGHPEPVEKPRVQSAARTIGILLTIAQSRDGLKGVEISQALRIPRQITYHLLHTLSSTGIIRKNEQHRYVLGLAAATIADGFRRQLAPPEHLAPIVRSVALNCGETAYATGWIDGEIVVLATARGHSPIQAAEVPPGSSSDAHARASGKLLLALADGSVRDGYLARHKLAARTPNTITSSKQLQAELERIRTRGYATDEEEYSNGLCCLAVPIAEGGIVLGLSAPAERFYQNFDRYLSALRAAANLNGAKTL